MTDGVSLELISFVPRESLKSFNAKFCDKKCDLLITADGKGRLWGSVLRDVAWSVYVSYHNYVPSAMVSVTVLCIIHSIVPLELREMALI